jgi:hypothetical protein
MKLNDLFTASGKVGTLLQYVTALALLIVVHLAGMSVYRGWATWICQLPALIIVMATAVARVYDISERSKRWFVRRMGFILVGTSCLGIALAPALGYSATFPSWKGVVFAWGLALVWLTTPGQPPWWKYINGEYKIDKSNN